MCLIKGKTCCNKKKTFWDLLKLIILWKGYKRSDFTDVNVTEASCMPSGFLCFFFSPPFLCTPIIFCLHLCLVNCLINSHQSLYLSRFVCLALVKSHWAVWWTCLLRAVFYTFFFLFCGSCVPFIISIDCSCFSLFLNPLSPFPPGLFCSHCIP